MFFTGINQTDHLTLAHLGVGPNATIQLEMKSANPEQVPLLAFKPRQEYHMPDVITVRVDGGKYLYVNKRTANLVLFGDCLYCQKVAYRFQKWAC